MERKEKNGKKTKKVEAANVGGVKKASKSPKKVEKKIKKSIKEGGKKVGGVKSVNGNAGSSKVNTRKRHQQLNKKKKLADDVEAMEVDHTEEDDTDYQPDSDGASDSESSSVVDVEEEEDVESSEMSEDSDDDEEKTNEEVEVVAPTERLTKKSERISAAAAAPRGDKRGVNAVKRYAEPDSLSKLDSINMTVEEQKAIFVKTNWKYRTCWTSCCLTLISGKR